ncbi:MAG TPA: polyphosphate kinase 2 family protein [Candidatus Limnocylindria bacterium]|nr:polyphosphate kinase 2 family protein [Candidatus Limnocylindria bacterium]
MAADFSKNLRVKPGKKVRLSHYDADATFGWQKGRKAKQSLGKAVGKLDALQYLMYAEHKRALLIVFQGLDAAGKDGTIRHVMSGINPQGCRVTSFREPSVEEAAHDFLWRIHAAVPRIGDFGVFNRSHYEDVLVVRVHNIVPKEVWSQRYDQINEFEDILAANNVRILKFFLHIGKDEQRRRFLERLDDPDKQWKLSAADFNERKYWDNYVQAYEDVLNKCSTPRAPWFIIPANKKWFRNLAVSHILVETLEGMKMKFPPPSIDVKKLKWR